MSRRNMTSQTKTRSDGPFVAVYILLTSAPDVRIRLAALLHSAWVILARIERVKDRYKPRFDTSNRYKQSV